MRLRQLFVHLAEETTPGEFEAELKAFSARMRERGVEMDLYVSNATRAIWLAMLEVPRGNRKQGMGTAAMKELCAFADKVGKRIELNVADRDPNSGTTSRSRLIRFYRRFGFVPNKGRNKDFRTRASMYRRANNHVVEVTGQLRTSQHGLRMARTSKDQILATMDPNRFIELTTPDRAEADQIRKSARSLLAYNRYDKGIGGDRMPFLLVQLDRDGSAKIVGHEGRHRAAALAAKNGRDFPLTIALIPSGPFRPKNYVTKDDTKDPIYYLTADDLPEVIRGQYDPKSILRKSELRILDPDLQKQNRWWDR
jgi:GNAT superfamily N-acetyltransferase